MNEPVIGIVVYILKKKAGSYDPAFFLYEYYAANLKALSVAFRISSGVNGLGR